MSRRYTISSDMCLYSNLVQLDRVPRPAVRAPEEPGLEKLVGRGFQILLGLAGSGAALHEGFGSALAVATACTLVPLLAGLLFVWLDSLYLDFDGLLPSSAKRTALLAFALVLPGALLGWYGVGILLALALLTLVL